MATRAARPPLEHFSVLFFARPVSFAPGISKPQVEDHLSHIKSVSIMAPVADSHDIAAAATPPPSTYTIEYPDWTRVEGCDAKLDSRSPPSKLRRRSRKQSCIRKERQAGGTSAIRRGVPQGDSEPVRTGLVEASDSEQEKKRDEESDSEDETQKTEARPQLIQPRPSNYTAKASSRLSATLPAPPANFASQPMVQAQPPPPPPPAATTTTSSPKEAATSKAKTPSRPPAKDLVQEVPPGNSPPWTSLTAGMSSSIMSATMTQSVGPPTTGTSSSLPALTAITTAPIPALTSDASKVTAVLLTAGPIVTSIDSSSSVRPTSSATALPTSGNDTSAQDHHDDGPIDLLPPKVEKALIAVGTIVGAIMLGVLVWLFWRLYRRRHGIGNARRRPRQFPRDLDTASERARLSVTKTLSRIPNLKEHMHGTERGWADLHHSDVGPFDAKASVASFTAAPQPSSPATIVVHTEIVRKSYHAMNQQEARTRLPAPEQSFSDIEAQHSSSDILGSAAQLREPRPSDATSLSSGFGDGQFEMDGLNGGCPANMPAATAAVVTTVNAPFSAAAGHESASVSSEQRRRRRRDTVCTEASQDVPPRFLSVRSWVRQQTSRVMTRAKRRDPSAAASSSYSSSTVEMPPPVLTLPPERESGPMVHDMGGPHGVHAAGAYGIAR
ncbi:hypothetical protein E4U41_000756 [Claviceps citrina]|nr:hypothetical protein E4U41_000756 [Claviceps citrina]